MDSLRKAKKHAIINELASYFEVLINDGYATKNIMSDGDYEYLSEQLLKVQEQAEIDLEHIREFAI